MEARQLAIVLVSLLPLATGSMHAATVSTSFEGLPDQGEIGSQVPGMTFSPGVISRTSGASFNRNQPYFPIHSGSSEAWVFAQQISITPDNLATSFSGYFTYVVIPGSRLTITAFDAAGMQLGQTTSAFDLNMNRPLGPTPTPPGQPSNEFLSLSTATPFTYLTIGDGYSDAANGAYGMAFTIDDITFGCDPVATAPEPATYGLIGLSLAGVALLRRKLGSH